jgi:uncharacterized protein YbbC (DUF1343 family)
LTVYYGIDVLERNQFSILQGHRVGLFTNLAAVNRVLVPTYKIFSEANQVDLRCFFSPEHGLTGMVADGVAIDSTIDSSTGLPVYSLYGEHQAPSPDMLHDIDVIVCDIQDIGVRYYTFIWTLTYVMEACGATDTPLIVLDRPNPLGDNLDGGPLDTGLSSLVGRFSVPIQHGMTIGELATMINAVWNPTPAQLTVIPCEGWTRDQLWLTTGRPFVPPSPNMPHVSTVQHYPGACLIEGTKLSEGRGTALPFEVVGAPFIDSMALADNINSLGIAGAFARPHIFQPTNSKFNGQHCEGIQLHITDVDQFRPITAWLQILQIIRQIYPDGFEWLPAHNGIQHFDRLIGAKETRRLLDDNTAIKDIVGEWDVFLAMFREQRANYLLYGTS